MRIIAFIGMGLLLASCASNQPINNRRVVTVGEAAQPDPEEGIRSGVYRKNSTNENLWLTVTNLRQQVEDLQRDQYEKKKLLQHIQKTNEDANAKNDRLRIRLNSGLEAEVVEDETPTVLPEKKVPKAVGYKDNTVFPTQVEYKDEFRLSNETSVKPGVGTKALESNPSREPASTLPEPVINEEVQ